MKRALAAVKTIRSLAPDDAYERLVKELAQLAVDLRERDALLRLAIEKSRAAHKSRR